MGDITAALAYESGSVGGVPPPFANVMLLSLRSFRERLKAIRKAHETFKSQGAVDFSVDDPWKENQGNAAMNGVRIDSSVTSVSRGMQPAWDSSEWLTMEA